MAENRAEMGVSPYICVENAEKAIEFYTNAFDATEKFRIADPGTGKIGHAEMSIGKTTLMLADEYPDMGFLGPRSLGGTPVTIHMYVDDVDAVAEKAVANGAKVLNPVADQFYGDRAGKFEDPFGHIWWIATQKEQLSLDEVRERAEKMMGGNN